MGVVFKRERKSYDSDVKPCGTGRFTAAKKTHARERAGPWIFGMHVGNPLTSSHIF